MDSIISGMKTIFGSVTEKLHDGITTILQDGDIQLTDAQMKAINGLFSNTINPFEKLGIRYQQDKYLENHLNYLVSNIPYRRQYSRDEISHFSHLFVLNTHSHIVHILYKIKNVTHVCNYVFTKQITCENFIPKTYCLYNKLSCMETFDNSCAGFRLQLSMCWVEVTQKPAMKKYTAVIMSPCLNHCKGYSIARLL